jgi:SulP family sulfate permease
MLPWGETLPSLATLRALFPAAFAIAILGAIESLLSAVIADGMTGKRHDPNAELVGLGLGNIVAPFFGGIAATGALARTATNVRAGARSPIAAVTHAAVVLGAIVVLAPLVAYIPMASLAALLLLVAWNMSEVHHFAQIMRVAPKSDVAVLLICFVLTVVFDMVIAVSVGVVLAALLFMNRMATLTHSRIFSADDVESERTIPAAVVLYEIGGPLFFGAVQSAMHALSAIGSDIKVVIIDLSRVPTIDATGIVALESALAELRRGRKFVIIAGPLPEPRRVFDRAKLETNMDHVILNNSLAEALETANDLVVLNPQWKKAAPDFAVS